jgi:cystathionine beta-lyase
MWMDATDVLPKGTNAEIYFKDVAGVGLTPGVEFGGGLGSVRLNYGCKRETLDEALTRMEEALARTQAEAALADGGAIGFL